MKPSMYSAMWIVFLLLLGSMVFRNVVFRPGILMTTDNNIGAVASVAHVLPDGFKAAWFDEPLLGQGAVRIPAGFTTSLFCLLSVRAYMNRVHLLCLCLASVFLFLFLRRHRLHPSACAFAAVTAYWLGSNLTLTFAGHTAKFGILFLSAAALYVTTFMRDRRLIIPAGIFGALAGMMFCEQQDVAIFFAMPLGGYFLLCLYRAGARWSARVAALGMASGLALVIASPALLSGYKTSVEGVAAVQESPQQKWNFATQWSWPPEESIDFIAPGYTGLRSGEPEGPYWGRMGRTPGWEQHHQGFMNFKLENTYLGIIPVLMAFFAMFWLPRPLSDKGGGEPAANHARSEVLFWTVACVLALLLAFGKYFPLYALLYRLPVVNSIRNPNKFLQIFQVALAILSAWGLHGLIVRDELAGGKRTVHAVLGVLGAFCLLVLFWLLARAGGGDIAALARIGWPASAANVISANKTIAVVHLLAMSLALLGVLWACLLLNLQARRRIGIAAAMVVLVSLDGIWLARHYITTMPASWIAANPVTETLKQELGANRVATLRQDGFYNLWLTYLFPYQGIRAFNFTQMPRMPDEYKKLLTAFQRDPFRLWQAGGVGVVLMPAEAYAQIAAQDAGRQLLRRQLAFDVFSSPENEIQTVVSDAGQHVLAVLAPEKAGRFRLVGGTRRFASAESALAWVADPKQPLFEQVAVHDAEAPDVAGSGNAGTVRVLRISASVIELDVEALAPAVLRCADRFDSDWMAAINGNPVPVFRADFCMMGVAVPPGRHTIRLEYRPSPTLLYVQLAGYALLAGLLLAAAWLFGNHRFNRGVNRA